MSAIHRALQARQYQSLCLALLLLALLLATATSSLSIGAMPISWQASLLGSVDALLGTHWAALAEHERMIVNHVRLPRLALALLVGAILAQCGAVMQGLFRNPLADPGIVGVSSGAATGAVLAIACLPAAWEWWSLPASAFVGGFAVTMLVYALAQRSEGTSLILLLLAGVAISAFAGALMGFISYFSDDQKLRALSLWQMGSLTLASNTSLLLCGAVLILITLCFRWRAQALDALLLGESEARHLGLALERIKLQLIALTALGVGVAVAFTGMIGFIGLVVPHLVRLIIGPAHVRLLPLSALCGAVLLAGADLLARTLAQPAELPVGVITALIGAPFFLVLLLHQRKRGFSHA